MLPTKRRPTHPGEMLLEEFLEPMGWTQSAFSEHLGITAARLNEIIRGKRGVTAQTAWLFAEALGTTPEFWLNLQSLYDLAVARPNKRRTKRIKPRPDSWAASASD